MTDFIIKGGALAEPGDRVRVEIGFNNLGELDLFLADEDQPLYDLFGNKYGVHNVMATLTRDQALEFHAWLSEQLYD